MSVLECILYPLLALTVIGYVIKTIWEIKNPEKVKARKEAKKQKKLAKKEAKNNGTFSQDQNDIYE